MMPPFSFRTGLALVASVAAVSSDTTSSEPFSGVPTYKLRDGNLMPKIGLGVYRASPGYQTYYPVSWALSLGYRLIDTAQMYENEESVGKAVEDSGIPRSEVFITTKLETDAHGYEEALAAAEESLKELNTSYVDLFLIHSPYGEAIVETWDALIKLQQEGKAKSIGVSNFGIKHLEAIRENGRPMPAVNQIELHPLNYGDRSDLIKYCADHDILITAYGSLFSGKTEFYEHETLVELTKKYNKTPAQVLLRWALENGVAVIPKSTSSKERLVENMSILDFELTKEEVTALSDMEGELDEYWDPVEDADVDVGDLSHGAAAAESAEL